MNEAFVLFIGFAVISSLFVVLLYKKVNNFLSSYISSIQKDCDDSEKILSLAQSNLDDVRSKFLKIDDIIDEVKFAAHSEIEAVISREDELTDVALKNHENVLKSRMDVVYNNVLNDLKVEIFAYFKEEVDKIIANKSVDVAKIDDDLFKIFDKALKENAKSFKNI